jgi:hypothetical protein
MWDFFKNWQPHEVLALFVAIGFFLTVIVAVVAASWNRVRREEIRANSIREMLDRGIPVDQVERLIGLPTHGETAANGKALEAQFASLLVQNEVPAPKMERVLRIYQETDPATKKAVYDSLKEIVGSSPSEEQLVAAVMALCPAHGPALPAGSFAEVPAAV